MVALKLNQIMLAHDGMLGHAMAAHLPTAIPLPAPLKQNTQWACAARWVWCWGVRRPLLLLLMGVARAPVAPLRAGV